MKFPFKKLPMFVYYDKWFCSADTLRLKKGAEIFCFGLGKYIFL